MQDTIKPNNIHIMGVPRGEESKAQKNYSKNYSKKYSHNTHTYTHEHLNIILLDL